MYDTPDTYPNPNLEVSLMHTRETSQDLSHQHGFGLSTEVELDRNNIQVAKRFYLHEIIAHRFVQTSDHL